MDYSIVTAERLAVIRSARNILSSERRTGAPACPRALSTGTLLGTGTLTGKPRGGAVSPGETPSFGVRPGGAVTAGAPGVFVAEPFPP
ncbi:hypothetical protein FQA47_005561 [Oryzias melastigma]|uniref:Uncharacterized protein n=1 Tax=Oryzias melastigma TaxID=30732 RepID=A0A834CGP7_ORYME|nr:hypothetical protein FQA47_005561 [Oryzias melastigma]